MFNSEKENEKGLFTRFPSNRSRGSWLGTPTILDKGLWGVKCPAKNSRG